MREDEVGRVKIGEGEGGVTAKESGKKRVKGGERRVVGAKKKGGTKN